jgi:uncharacterized protein YwgA
MNLAFSNNLLSAYLTEFVRSFQTHYPNGFLGRTAMQKLVYFGKSTGVPVPCSFEIYNYGPYSDQVTFKTDGLLADEILADTSPNSKYSNYRLQKAKVPFSTDIEKKVAPYRKQIEVVVKNLGSFRPEQLELIATLHFVHHRLESILGKKPSQSSVFAEFHRIKGDKFDRSEVSAWYDALKRSGLA